MFFAPVKYFKNKNNKPSRRSAAGLLVKSVRRPSALVSHAAGVTHRDFGLPAAARALYFGPQSVCARRLPTVRPRKPRARDSQSDYYI